jgi:pimeloyl-ACP methyl ester carboxylesterase
VTVIHGEQDVIAPARELAPWAAALPAEAVHLLPNTGHVAMLTEACWTIIDDITKT